LNGHPIQVNRIGATLAANPGPGNARPQSACRRGSCARHSPMRSGPGPRDAVFEVACRRGQSWSTTRRSDRIQSSFGNT
jgi:hypothetical protein